MVVFIAFISLIVLTATNKTRLAAILAKSREDWVIDIIGLFFQGVIIPILQLALVYQLYQFFLPADRGCLNLHPIVAFFLSFVFVDYLYYWNHRLLHSRWLWPLHRVHHTMTEMDVLGTSRNTLWTSFFILYLWVHALFIYLLSEPTWYIAGVSLTSALDLWRHSAIFSLRNANGSTPWPYSWLSVLLILPQDHAWHHASDSVRGNYGANLKLWDRMHGTYYASDKLPNSLGIPTNLTLNQKLLWPF